MQMHVNAAIDSDLDHISSEKNPGIKQVRERERERDRQRAPTGKYRRKSHGVVSFSVEYALVGAGQYRGQSGGLGQGFYIHLFQKFKLVCSVLP